MKKEAKKLNGKKCIGLMSDCLPMQKHSLATALSSSLKSILIFALFLLLLPAAFADFWTNQPSHQTLYGDTITSKTAANPVTIADAEGLIVTTGNVGIGTASPNYNLQVSGGTPKIIIQDTSLDSAANALH